MVVHRIFDTTTRDMGGSTHGIGIIQRPGKILVLKRDGGHGVALTWIIVSLRNFFDMVVNPDPVRVRQHLLLGNSLRRVREFRLYHRTADHHLLLVEGYQVVLLRLPKRDLDGQAELISQGSSQIMSIPV